MRTITNAAFALVAILATSPAHAKVVTYLDVGRFDPAGFLPQPPIPGSAVFNEDRRVFVETRALENTARWRQAVADIDMSPEAMVAAFASAATMPPDLRRLLRLRRLLFNMRPQVAAVVDGVRPRYNRKRPFLLDAGRTCQDSAAVAGLSDYPSGHSTWGMAVALVIAEMTPTNSVAVISRGISYGESRVVCGMHNASTVQTSRMLAAAIVAAMHGSPRFRSDLRAARAELAHFSRN